MTFCLSVLRTVSLNLSKHSTLFGGLSFDFFLMNSFQTGYGFSYSVSVFLLLRYNVSIFPPSSSSSSPVCLYSAKPIVFFSGLNFMAFSPLVSHNLQNDLWQKSVGWLVGWLAGVCLVRLWTVKFICFALHAMCAGVGVFLQFHDIMKEKKESTPKQFNWSGIIFYVPFFSSLFVYLFCALFIGFDILFRRFLLSIQFLSSFAAFSFASIHFAQ